MPMILDYSLRSPFGSPVAIKRKRLSGFRQNDEAGSSVKPTLITSNKSNQFSK
jgi:hypothetical protein